jgi:hypothetical protein
MRTCEVTDYPEELAQRVETIERGYEYLLAFAAQGRRDDAGSEVRATLIAMHAALETLSDVIGAAVKAGFPVPAPGAGASTAVFMATLADDARRAGGAIAFVLSCPMISSLLVDNLNASTHVRTLLTDVFLADQALK